MYEGGNYFNTLISVPICDLMTFLQERAERISQGHGPDELLQSLERRSGRSASYAGTRYTILWCQKVHLFIVIPFLKEL